MHFRIKLFPVGHSVSHSLHSRHAYELDTRSRPQIWQIASSNWAHYWGSIEIHLKYPGLSQTWTSPLAQFWSPKCHLHNEPGVTTSSGEKKVRVTVSPTSATCVRVPGCVVARPTVDAADCSCLGLRKICYIDLFLLILLVHLFAYHNTDTVHNVWVLRCWRGVSLDPLSRSQSWNSPEAGARWNHSRRSAIVLSLKHWRKLPLMRQELMLRVKISWRQSYLHSSSDHIAQWDKISRS